MASPVNRKRRRKAFSRGHDRPQGSNPYQNSVLAKLWTLGRERRLAASGGIMPIPPRPTERPAKRQAPPGRGRPGGDRGGSSGGGQHRGWR
jgi:hypothetical protein